MGGEGLGFDGDGGGGFEVGAGLGDGGFVGIVEEAVVGAGLHVEEGDPAVDGVGDGLDFGEAGGGPVVGGGGVIGGGIALEGEPLGEGGGAALGEVVFEVVPGVEGGGGAEAAEKGDGVEGEGVVAILSADADEDGGAAAEFVGFGFDLVEVAGTEDDGPGEFGIGLEEESGDPAAFTEAGDVGALGIDVVFADEVMADGAEDGEFLVEGIGVEGELASLDVGHAGREPAFLAGVVADEFGVGGAVGAVVVEDEGPLFGGVVVFREDDLDAVGEVGVAEFEAFGIAEGGGGEGEEEKDGEAHDRELSGSEGGASNGKLVIGYWLLGD